MLELWLKGRKRRKGEVSRTWRNFLFKEYEKSQKFQGFASSCFEQNFFWVLHLKRMEKVCSVPIFWHWKLVQEFMKKLVKKFYELTTGNWFLLIYSLGKLWKFLSLIRSFFCLEEAVPLSLRSYFLTRKRKIVPFFWTFFSSICHLLISSTFTGDSRGAAAVVAASWWIFCVWTVFPAIPDRARVCEQIFDLQIDLANSVSHQTQTQMARNDTLVPIDARENRVPPTKRALMMIFLPSSRGTQREWPKKARASHSVTSAFVITIWSCVRGCDNMLPRQEQGKTWAQCFIPGWRDSLWLHRVSIEFPN